MNTKSSNSDPTNSNLFAGDGRPFTKADKPAPPEPGGTWPGDPESFPGMFRGYAPTLTKATLDTPEKRRAALLQFVECGYSSAAGTRPEETLIALAWDESQGVDLTADDFRILEAGRKRIVRFNKAADAKQENFLKPQRLKKLDADRQEGASRLRSLQNKLSEAEKLLVDPTEAIGAILEDPYQQLGTALTYISRVSAAREVVKLLRKDLIPSAESALASVDAELKEAA